MNELDRTKLDEMAPSWVDVDAFETRYPQSELEGFVRDAMDALERAGLVEYLTGLETDIDTAWVSVREDRPDIRHALDEALPDGVYRIDVSEAGLAVGGK